MIAPKLDEIIGTNNRTKCRVSKPFAHKEDLDNGSKTICTHWLKTCGSDIKIPKMKEATDKLIFANITTAVKMCICKAPRVKVLNFEEEEKSSQTIRRCCYKC